MIYLHKIIPLITSPLFFVLTLLVILIILRKSKLIKLKNSLLFLSFLTLFLFSNPLISNKLVKYIEAPYLPVKLSEVPESDYIVVLSGMVHQVKDDVYEWSDPDRFFAGIKLLNAKKDHQWTQNCDSLPKSIRHRGQDPIELPRLPLQGNLRIQNL